MIVATAGHVDHGKTALVKALTGIDTDRLPEEKARGISIDLGFAYADTPAGACIGFVDVPGHERFVRNMIAGVCGIDAVLLVVAADDGVMPQTREHLAIADLLGIKRGLIAISKVDCASSARMLGLRHEIAALLEGTGLVGVEIVETSVVTGAGVDELRSRLYAAADERALADQQQRRFRYAIDRAFSVAGSGTVVTGTVFQGSVARGDRLKLAPSGVEVRVRGIQKAHLAVETAQAGERCALNLAGVERQHATRGHWVVADDATTTRLDVRLRVLADAPAIGHWASVHLHIGTSDVNARIAMAGGATLASGSSGMVQLLCDAPISAVVGDRFIVRDHSAQRTLGGGFVVDPYPPRRTASRTVRSVQLDAMATLSPQRALPALLAVSAGGVDLALFGRAFNLEPAYRDQIAREAGAQIVCEDPPRALPGDVVVEIKNAIVVALARFHRESPQAKGLELEMLRPLVARALQVETFVQLVRRVAAELNIEVTGSMVRRIGHVATANHADELLWQRVMPNLLDAGVRGQLLSELAADLHIQASVLADFLHRKSASGDVVRVTSERFYPREVLAQLAAFATELASQSPDQSFIAARFRDRAGVNRAVAIQILECLDRIGITQRVGDARKIRRDYASILGSGRVPALSPDSVRPSRAPAVRPRIRAERGFHTRS
ncbi:MAG: selenocysteine-specific translation elongation factor [Casimicrobiaceae bacterium]